MKKILFIVLFVVLIAVGGLGAAGHFGKGPLAPILFKGPAEPPPPPPPDPHRILYLGEVITPIIRDHAIEKQIGMDIDVDVWGPGVDRYNARASLISDRVRIELYNFLPEHSDTKSEADRQAVHDRVKYVVETALGPGLVREVTIRTFYSR